MKPYPLLLRNLLERPVKLFPKKGIVSFTPGRETRYNYKDFYGRVGSLGQALAGLGVRRGDRVASFAWNSHRHLELYFAVPCFGAVLHTVNVRLFPQQVAYIMNHAEDRFLFLDEDLLPVIEGIAPLLKTVEGYIVMTEGPALPETTLSPVYSYEALLAAAPSPYPFPEDLDEDSPAVMCYTSATTGNPKGVIYTHRGIFLHSMSLGMVDTRGLSERDVILYVVPMFHANAWGMPFAATWLGSTQVFPGPRPDPRTICQIIQKERVTLTGAVPTVWVSVLELLEKEKYDLSSLRQIICGGSAVPRSLIEAYDKKLGIPIKQGYGMTEAYPGVSSSTIKSYLQALPEAQRYDVMAKQGVFAPGLEVKVVNERGEEVPWGGGEIGELVVRGPWIVQEYFKEPERSAQTFRDGWFYTGDIVAIDEEGYIQVVDRAKDIIKSGGEWISSVDLEAAIMAHPAVLEAAVIGIPHPRWQERPLACVALKPSFTGRVTQQHILDFLQDRIARWWLPDRVVFMEEVPKTGVGKFDKKLLREKFKKGEGPFSAGAPQ